MFLQSNLINKTVLSKPSVGTSCVNRDFELPFALKKNQHVSSGLSYF